MKSHPKQTRYISKSYRDFIKSQPCLICGCTPSEPHHEGSGVMGGKVDDTRCIPLCFVHHIPDRHHYGKETFYSNYSWLDYKEEIIRLLTTYIQENEL